MSKGSKAMDALKAALAERQAKAQKLIAETGQKWVRRDFLEQKRQEEYFESVRIEQEKEKAEEEARIQKLAEHLARRDGKVPDPIKPIPAHILNDALLGDDDAEPPVSVQEVMERLREMACPITLFGETDMQRYKRMRFQEKEAHEGRKNPDLIMLENIHATQRDEMLQGDKGEEAAAEEDDDDDDEEGGEGKAKKRKVEEPKSESEEEPESSEEGTADTAETAETAASSSDLIKGDAEGQAPAEGEKPVKAKREKIPDADLPQVDVDVALMDKCDFIRAWARKALKAWEKELADKPEEEKKKVVVKNEIAAHRQVRRDVRPLQRRLRLYIMEEWLLDKIHNIVKHASEREYRNAAEAYLDLSIGKAAWPVGLGCGGGVLMEDAIGLHDRFNRNAQVKDIAFALNDDVTRKFVQALKRLMNVAQRYWPPDDPSKA